MSDSEQPVVSEASQVQPTQTNAQASVPPEDARAEAFLAPAAGGAPVVASPEITRPGSRSDKDVAFWRGVIDEWNALLDAARLACGLLPSIRGFCRERKLRETSFYSWRRELAIRDGRPLPTMRAMDSTRVAGHRPAKPEPTGAFVQLKVRPTAPASTNALCEIVAGKVVVRVATGFDANGLSSTKCRFRSSPPEPPLAARSPLGFARMHLRQQYASCCTCTTTTRYCFGSMMMRNRTCIVLNMFSVLLTTTQYSPAGSRAVWSNF